MTERCTGCGGTLSATRRVPLDTVRTIHEATCPGVVRVKRAAP